MGIGAVAFAILGALLVSGLWLVVRGLLGDRTDAHRACKACGFDLSGLEASRCPECGADLGPASATRVVKRRRNLKRAAVGGVLVLLALAGPVSVLIDSAISGRLSGVLPTPVLALELHVLGARTPRAVTDELLVRCGKGEVSDATMRLVALAIVEMPGKPGEGSLAPSLNQLVGDAATKGLISKNDLARHVITPRLLEAKVPERAWPGDPLVGQLVNYSASESRTPLSGAWVITKKLAGVEIDGVPQPTRAPKSQQEAADWLSSCTYTPTSVTYVQPPAQTWQSVAVPIARGAPPGKHTVRLRFIVEVSQGPADPSPGRAEAVRDYSVEVIAPDAPLVTLADDEAWRQQIASTLRVSVMRQRGSLSAGFSVSAAGKGEHPGPTVQPAAPGVRIGGAWSMFLEVDGTRVLMGKFKVCWRTESGVAQSIWSLSPTVPAAASTCRVIFVPDERYGVEREAIDLMPAGEIVIEDVPIN